MMIDASKEPSQHIVFFHHVRLQVGLGCHFKNFILRDHSAVPMSIGSGVGTNSRQRVISRSPLSDGSSCALPLLSRDLQAVVNGWLSPRICSARKPSRLNAAPLPSFSAYSTSRSALK